jgi:hypothetical protein
MASAFGWFATCVSFFLVEPTPRLRLIAMLGILISVLFMLMKLLPIFPGHFSVAEWIALSSWLAIGFLLHRRPKPL